jgi:riboflavin kinase/FMN adenylyltransferase
MKIIRGLHNLSQHKGCVVTIGNFDGVHLGHQEVISRALIKSKSLGVPFVVVTFFPTPQSFFSRPQPSISSFKDKHLLLDSLGVDVHLIINFNKRFSEIRAEDFIEQLLVEKLKMGYCLVGDDFRFGKDRIGDFKMLERLSYINGFHVESTSSVLHKSDRISSSEIRSLLCSGEFALASSMLGREFSITGKIIHGDKKGRTIGFPTINIPIKRKISPILGVFAVEVEIDNKRHYGVCNLGKRPTVDGLKTLLEVHIFNFDYDVYGLQAKVIFKKKIRNEERFPSIDALKQQISLDTQATKDYFKI